MYAETGTGNIMPNAGLQQADKWVPKPKWIETELKNTYTTFWNFL
jgi:hypothetical protein